MSRIRPCVMPSIRPCVIEFYPNKLPDSYEGTPWCAVGTFADGLSQSPLKSPQRLTVVPYVRTCCFVFGFAPGIPGLKPGRGSYSLFSNYSRSDFGSDYYSDYTLQRLFSTQASTLYLVSIPNRSPSLSNVLTKPAVEVRVGLTGTIRIRAPSQT